MKINGIKVDAPSFEIVPILRPTGNIIIQCGAVLNYEDFENLYPRPVPPSMILAGGETKIDSTDKKYLKAIGEWAEAKTNWMVVQSLKATENFEWETVVENDPTTWGNWAKELEDAKFNSAEINRIFEGVTSACGLNQAKIDEALKDFLAGVAAAQKA
jgi:hypothetical protein